MRFKNKSELFASTFIWLIEIYYSLSYSWLGVSVFSLYKIVVYFAMFFFILYIISRKAYSKQELKWITVLFVLSFISAYSTREFTLFLSLFSVISAMHLNRIKLFKQIFYIKFAFAIANILLSLMGVLPIGKVFYQRTFSLFGFGISRYSLGFSHPNVMGMIVFELIVLYICSFKNGKRLSNANYILFFLLSLVVFIICGSRTAFFATIILLILLKLTDIGILTSEFQSRASVFIITFGCLFSIFGVKWLYENCHNIFVFFDRILQTRLNYIYLYQRKFGVTFLGNYFADYRDFWAPGGHATSSLTLDSGYGTLVIKYGIAISCFFILVYWLYIKRDREMSNYFGCVLLVLTIYSFSENVLIFITKNITLFYLTDLMQKGRNTIYEKVHNKVEVLDC